MFSQESWQSLSSVLKNVDPIGVKPDEQFLFLHVLKMINGARWGVFTAWIRSLLIILQ